MGCDDIAGAGQRYLGRALDLVSSIELPELRNSAYSILVRDLSEHGLFDVARQVLERIDDDNLRMQGMRDLAIALISANRIKDAVDIISQIELEEFRTAAIKEAIKKLLEFDMLEEVNKLMGLVDTSRHRDEALRSIAEYMAAHGRVDEAISYANKIDNPIIRASTKGRIALHVGDAPTKERLFNEAIKEILEVKDVLFFGADEKSFLRDFELTSNKILELENIYFLVSKAGMDDLARKIMDKILELIDQIGELDEKYEVLRLLIRNAVFLAPDIEITPLVNKALSEVESIGNPLVKAQIYRVLGLYHIRRGDLASAVQFLNNALKSARELDSFERDTFLREMGIDILRLGQPKLAEQLIKHIYEPRFKIDIIAELVARGGGEDLLGMVTEILDEILDPSWLVYALVRVVEMYLRLGRIDEVGSLLKRFDETLEEISNAYTKATIMGKMAAKLLVGCKGS